jgi:hypothetical protein
MGGLAAGGAAAAESTVYHLEMSGSRHDTATATELKAFAAAHLPHSVMLYQAQVLGSSAALVFDSKAIYEIRRYEPTVPEPAILARHGIQPILMNESTMVLEFEGLAARDNAWNAVSSDAEWKRSKLCVAEIGLYRYVR